MNSGSAPETADPSAAEDALAAQPIGYWSGAVHKAVINQVRDAMSTVDVMQPQWWTLTRVGASGGITREDMATQLGELVDTPHEIPRAIDQLLHRGWIESDETRRLYLTDVGRTAQARIRALVADLRARIHEGVSDEEYVVALKVMRRMISNSGSAAS